MEAFQYSKNIEKEAYEKGYAQGVNNGYEDGNKQGYAERKCDEKRWRCEIMLYTEEQIRRANERSISDYFRQEGYSCKKIRSETHIAGFGGFYVKDTAVPNSMVREFKV